MFSKECEYGIRALTIIAKATEKEGRVGIKEIYKQANTPESFTAKILQKLVRKQIIKSQKGPSGGFYIARKLSEISLLEVVEAIDGTEIFNKCGLGLEACDASRPCPLHFKFEKIRNTMFKMCKSSNLESLIKNLNQDTYSR